MRILCSHFGLGLILAAVLAVPQPAAAQIWRHFLPTSGDPKAAAKSAPAASPKQTASTLDGLGSKAAPSADGNFALSQERGPWLIVAASFSGEGAEQQANDLAAELRSEHRIAAYVHEMKFRFDDETAGQTPNGYGTTTRRHYQRGDESHEISVLVGDFQSIDDPDAQQMLNRIKTLQPKALAVDPNQTKQTMAQVRKSEDDLFEKLGKPRKRGPMAQAFFTRNPMLPREYFVPKGVDPFVAKMNDGVEYSLLSCPGRQSIKVATFRGKTILQTSAQSAPDSSGSSFWGHKKKDDINPLIEAAENAHLLTKELREHGWEAYEFHDRTESIVTIGSFAEVTQRLPDGRVVVIPQVQKIVQTFDASYDTPADPLTGIGNDSATRQRVAQEEQQVSLQLTSKQAQIVPGMNPKHVKIMQGRGKNAKVDRIIPMDVHPTPVDVPKRSISSAYAG